MSVVGAVLIVLGVAALFVGRAQWQRGLARTRAGTANRVQPETWAVGGILVAIGLVVAGAVVAAIGII